MTTLYKKVGRRYRPVAMAELDLDALEQAAREAGGGCWFSTGWTVGSRGFEVGDLKSRDRICSDVTERCAEFIAAANPAAISELLDRLEAAEKAVNEAYQRGYDAGQEEIEKERDALRAKIAEMERQEPVAKVESWTNGSYTRHYKLKWLRDVGEGDRLYALPGAQTQGEEK